MIHYHGLPMTPANDMIKSFAGKHAMISFEHPEQIKIASTICHSIALDNGAFSAWRAKRKHDFAGYIAWCELWLKHPAVDWCIIPDVIDGDEAANDDLLAAWPISGNQSVPVYHMHESLERLDRLADYPRIALGSSGDYATPGTREWWLRIGEMMEVICDSDGMPRTKLHGLRMLDPVIFSHIPMASADSCNVARNVGIDKAWNGPYAPRSHALRALIIMERIEMHAASVRWSGSAGVQQNFELLG
jgi:hypothetical protein